jgi:hypothetical protein
MGSPALLMMSAAQVPAASSPLLSVNRREVRARSEARARRDLAIEAIGTFTEGAAEDLMLRQPGLLDLRKKLLGSALAYNRKLQSRLEADPDGSPTDLASAPTSSNTACG